MTKWNYYPTTLESSTGYEDVMEELKLYNKQYYLSLSNEKQEDLIEHIFQIYRSKNIFPIRYYNQNGIKQEIIKCQSKEVSFEGDVLNLSFNQGSSLCRFLFPNLLTVSCKGAINNTPLDKFNDDYKLKKAIKFCLEHKSTATPITPSGLKDGLDMIGGNVATNFKPMNAKALYEKFCPVDGVIYDFASGFGGRMLGALSSKNNYKYFGVEPCEETFNNLNILGKHIEESLDRENCFKVFKKGSEEFRTKNPNTCDFAFSSPPYFNLEVYSDEDTQCYNRYSNLEEWFKGYVKPTIENIHYMLKDNCYYAVNIADFKNGKEEVKYVDEWIRISQECGFTFVKQIHMKLQTRRGNGHDETNLKSKKEGIFLFRKEVK